MIILQDLTSDFFVKYLDFYRDTSNVYAFVVTEFFEVKLVIFKVLLKFNYKSIFI
jgi:hypothetical protein